MTDEQREEYNQMVTKYSNWVYSLDIRNVPDYVLKESGISEEEYKIALKSPILQTSQGILLINEALPHWEAYKDIFFALSMLPESLLKDIYKIETKRYKHIKKSKKNILNPKLDTGEQMRRAIYFLYIPNLLEAYKDNKIKHI